MIVIILSLPSAVTSSGEKLLSVLGSTLTVAANSDAHFADSSPASDHDRQK